MDRRKFFGISAVGTASLLAAPLAVSQTTNSSGTATPILMTTLQQALSATVSVGELYRFSDRSDGLFEVVSGQTNVNGFNIIAHSTDNVSFVLRTDNQLNVRHFGAVGDGVADDTAAIQAAIALAGGRVVYVPSGTYVITSTLKSNLPKSFGPFAPGIKIIGAGGLNTFFDNQVANEPMIDIDSPRHPPCEEEPCQPDYYEASWGSVLKEFAIINNTSPTDSIGIRVLNGYQILIEHLYIKGMTAYGIELRNGLFLDDGWNMVSIKNCWIDSCKKWGIKADGSSGRNEGSYTYLEQVFFQTNGTSDGGQTPPTSGGMIWKGQIMTMENSGFANGNHNVGLYIKGDAGMGQTVDLRNTTFENCHTRGLYCSGILLFKGRNLQFYNKEFFTAQSQCEFDAAGSGLTIRHVDIDGVTIRATEHNNNMTAFKLAGPNVEYGTCSVRNVNWENFDHAGQTRFDGFKDKPTLIAHRTSSQLVYPSPTLIEYDQIDSDIQGILEDANTGLPGRFVLHYRDLFTVKGKVTLAGLDAGALVTIQLYTMNTVEAIQECIYVASGLAKQTFDFDFSGELGADFTTRTYQINVTQGSNGSRSMDASNKGYNTLMVQRLPRQL